MESFRYGSVLKFVGAKKGYEKNLFFHLRKISSLFRVMELFVVMFVLSRVSSQLPDAFRSSVEYFKDFKVMVLSPWFIFVLGNAIVITLFAKSGRLAGQDAAPKNDFYHEFIGKSERLNYGTVQRVGDLDYQDKHVVFEKANRNQPKWDAGSPPRHSGDIKAAVYRRTQSVKLMHKQDEKPNRELRRSATENRMKRVHSTGKLSIEGPFPEDSLSNDEFRRTVEAFIARQQRYLRDEEHFAM